MIYLFLCIVLAANLILLLGCFFIVLLTYSIYWYEYSNRHPDAYDQRFSWSNLKLAGTLILPETWLDYLTIIALPFGLRRKRAADLKRGTTPTLLLNGLFVNRSCWFWFKRQLRQRGIENIVTMNLSAWHSEEVLTELVAKQIDELRHRIGVNKVNLVCHSFGGMIARNYVQLRGGESKVEHLICLGSPHQGSKLATFSITPIGKILIPGSDFLQRLNAAPEPAGVALTNIHTTKDNMVLPNSNTLLPWGRSVELDNMGHTSLIYRKPAIEATVTALMNREL